MEEKRKNEQVHCPVCRALWLLPMPSSMPVSVPVQSNEEGVPRSKVSTGSSPAAMVLSEDKMQLLERLKEVCMTVM